MDKSKYTYDKEDLYKTLDRINLWITNSESKTSIIMAAICVVLAIILSMDYVIKYKGIVKYMLNQNSEGSYLYLGAFFISIFIIGKGCYHLFRVLVPQTTTDKYKESGVESSSLIFFSTIAKIKSYEQYKSSIEDATESNQRNDLLSQIYICSKRCDEKFKSYRRGIVYTGIGFISFFIISIIGFVIV